MSDQRTSSKTATAVTTVTDAELSAEEEKVLRMRHGFAVPSELPLDRPGADNPETRARLDAMERELFKKSGRLDELRREVGLEERPATDDGAKSKIVDRLKDKLGS